MREKNGVQYCIGYAEARLLTLYVTSEEDIKSALMLLEMEQEVLDWE